MFLKFQNHIANNFPRLKGKKLLLAVSGGIDSMVLLHLFAKLEYEIAIAHCNFQLRGAESETDEKFVKNESRKLQIPIFTIQFETEKFAQEHKLSIQMAARKLRYAWFSKLLVTENFDFVLTAHHLNDALETFLINFTRGTGLEGLTGIPEQNGTIIRPLLPFSRLEIEQFANDNKIAWREDSSNASDKYLRNKFRHDVVPIFQELNPSFLSSFQQSLHYLKDAEKLVLDASKKVFDEVAELNENQIKFSIQKLLEYPNYKAYLYQWLKEYQFKAWEDIYELVTAQSGKKIFSETHYLLKDREFLFLVPIKPVENQNFIIKNKKCKVNIPLKIRICNVNNISNSNSNCIFVDEDKIEFPLIIRKWQEGDEFYPFGMKGKKKLSKYFKDEKYSLFDKENQWLLCSHDKIVWLIGKRADERFKITETTQNILKIDLE